MISLAGEGLNDREIVGASEIARRAGCSLSTVMRLWKAGQLDARQADLKAPLRMRTSAVEALKSRRAR